MSKIVTGTYYLRPNSDISVGHSASTSPAWQSVADDKGDTWIYSTSSDYTWSTFGMGLYSGTIPDVDYTITSVVLHVNHQAEKASSLRYGYFRYSWYMNDVEYSTDLVERKNDDRVDYSNTFSSLKISATANTIPTTTIKGGTKRGGWLSFQNRISQMYLEVNWRYEIPEIVVYMFDNTSDKRVSYGENVSLTPVQNNIESKISSDGDITISEVLKVNKLCEFFCPMSNTSNTINCTISDPTIACTWGKLSIGEAEIDGGTTEENMLKLFEQTSYLLDGGPGVGMDFGQLQSDYPNYVVCVLFDAKIYKGNKQMLPITRPIYIGNERVSSVLCNVEFLYGFYGYKLASDEHHLIADTANYPPNEEVIVEE